MFWFTWLPVWVVMVVVVGRVVVFAGGLVVVVVGGLVVTVGAPTRLVCIVWVVVVFAVLIAVVVVRAERLSIRTVALCAMLPRQSTWRIQTILCDGRVGYATAAANRTRTWVTFKTSPSKKDKNCQPNNTFNFQVSSVKYSTTSLRCSQEICLNIWKNNFRLNQPCKSGLTVGNVGTIVEAHRVVEAHIVAWGREWASRVLEPVVQIHVRHGVHIGVVYRIEAVASISGHIWRVGLRGTEPSAAAAASLRRQERIASWSGTGTGWPLRLWRRLFAIVIVIVTWRCGQHRLDKSLSTWIFVSFRSKFDANRLQVFVWPKKINASILANKQ